MRYSNFARRQPRPLWRSLLDLLFFLIVLTATIVVMNYFGLFYAGQGNVEVVDGDSLRLKGTNIRLQGIDAPEYLQTCTDAAGQDYACGKQARRALATLVNGREVSCQSVETDQYGRALSTCMAGDVDIAREMVLQGWAIAYRGLRYVNAENLARKERKGLWAGNFEKPADYRARERLVKGSMASTDNTADAGE